jgi:MATE family multidrug resistance protein
MTQPVSSPSSLLLRHFLHLAAVNSLSNLLVPLAGLLDTAFLGHLADIRHLAGVVLATVIFNYLYWTFGFLRMGTTGMTAQAVGRGDRDTTILIVVRHGLLAVLLGGAIVLLQHPIRTLGFALLSASPEVKAAGQAYYDAMVWGAPATLLNFVWVGWFLGQEHSGKVLLLSAVNNVCNIVLNYVFIFLWGWGAAGAGLATASSQVLMAIVGLILAGRETSWQQIWQLRHHLLDMNDLGAMIHLNRAILVRTFALLSAFAGFTNLSASLGTGLLTANALMLQVVTLAAYFIDGLAFATESLAGIFQGRGDRHNLVQLLQVAGRASLVLGLGFATVVILMPGVLFGMLTSHSDVVDRIRTQVVWLLPILGFGSLAYMLDGYFLGLTAGRVLQTSALISTLVGFFPIALLGWKLQNVHLLWLALTTFMATRAGTLALAVPNTLNSKS